MVSTKAQKQIKGYISAPRPMFGQYRYYVSKTRDGLGKAISDKTAEKLIKTGKYIII